MDEPTSREITRLLKRGLQHYGFGELEAAIGCWEQVMALDSKNEAARDYLETANEELEAQKTGASGEPDSHGDATVATFDRSPDAAAPASEPPDTRVAAALAAYKQGDLDGAWQGLQSVAEASPERLDVQGYLVMVRGERAKRWAREIGDQGRSLRRARSMQEIMKLNLQPDEGYLLTQLDGSLTVEQLISLSQTDRVRTLEIIARFLRDGLVE